MCFDTCLILIVCVQVRDAVLSQAEHAITIDTHQIKLKVYKPSNVMENADSTEQQVSIIICHVNHL